MSHAPCPRCGNIVRDHDETGEPGTCHACSDRPIERYALRSVEIASPHPVWTDGRVVAGEVFVGVQYDEPTDAEVIRNAIPNIVGLAIAECWRPDSKLDALMADRITRATDSRLVARFGIDRARFVEVWNGDGAMTQTYKPFGMPRSR